MPPVRVPDTIVDFLHEATTQHGSRNALLIKPAFRYIRWSYDQLWEDSGRVATLIQRRGLVKGDQATPVGPQLPSLGPRLLRLPQGGCRTHPPGPSQRS